MLVCNKRLKSIVALVSIIAFSPSTNAQAMNEVDTITSNDTTARVSGIGGIFIKAKDPTMLRDWYKQHLGIDVQIWGGTAFR
jgi:hypothetical protein